MTRSWIWSFSSCAPLSAGAVMVGAGAGAADGGALAFAAALVTVVVSVAMGSGGDVKLEQPVASTTMASKGLITRRKTSRNGVEVKSMAEISDKVCFQACRASSTSKTIRETASS